MLCARPLAPLLCGITICATVSHVMLHASETRSMIGKRLGPFQIQSIACHAHFGDALVVESVERVGQLIAWARGAR